MSGVVRWKVYLDWLISRYAEKKVKNEVKHLLWVSMYQVSFMKKADYHVVNEAVEFAKRVHGPTVANFVNALLRRLVSEQHVLSHRPLPELPPTRYSSTSSSTQNSELKIQNLSIAYSFPQWLVRRWLKRFGRDETVRLLTLLNTPPEFCIRVNSDRIFIEEVISRLEQKGIAVRRGKYLDTALYVDKLGQVLKDDLFTRGLIRVQDEASQLAGSAIGPKVDGTILDACAGLGTKTGQLAGQQRGSRIIAMDKEMKRLKLVPDGIDLVKGDAVFSPFRDAVFDAILLDAPCSSLGIIRKHPEIKWRRQEREIARFGEYQLRLLESLWRTLKPGAHMVYSVCSFEPEETVSVIERFRKEEAFILENPLPFLFNKAELSSLPAQTKLIPLGYKEYFLSLPHDTAMDGFFIARLKKI